MNLIDKSYDYRRYICKYIIYKYVVCNFNFYHKTRNLTFQRRGVSATLTRCRSNIWSRTTGFSNIFVFKSMDL